MTTVERPDLGCAVQRLSYSFAERSGMLHMAEGHNCDMQGCIALFLAIDPGVIEIRTFAGLLPDTKYLRSGDDWQAIG